MTRPEMPPAGPSPTNDPFIDADLLLLGLSVAYMDGDRGLLAELEAAASSAKRQKLNPDVAGRVRQAAAALLARGPDVMDRPSAELSNDFLGVLVRCALGFDPAPDHMRMLLEQAGFEQPISPASDGGPNPARATGGKAPIEALIVGAGMSGICTAMALKQAGIPFRILEKSDRIGGTWAVNAYPGCGVDTPSFFYSYSFAQNPGWSRYFVRREEVLSYFQDCVTRFDLARHIVFGTELTRATFHGGEQKWIVETRGPDGATAELRCDAVITAIGQLNLPARPLIPGLDGFRGQVVHTAEWTDANSFAGKRAALIGVGASSMQAGPAMAGQVSVLKVFQREPHWIMPNRRYQAEVPEGERLLQRRLPVYLRLKRLQMIWAYGDVVYPALKVDPAWQEPERSLNELSDRYRRLMTAHIEEELRGRPDLLAKVVPPYPPYGKRVLLDNNWYRMLRRENVELITSGISRVDADSIWTSDGERHEVDLIVLATGFQASKMLWPMEFINQHGSSLRQVWDGDDPRAYLGITVPGFPNLFLTYGPNTNLGFGGSATSNAEFQARYVAACLKGMAENGWATLECRKDVHDTYNDAIDRMHEQMVWSRGNVTNWFRNKRGRVTANMPWSMLDYWKLTREPCFSDFIVRSRDGSVIEPDGAEPGRVIAAE